MDPPATSSLAAAAAMSGQVLVVAGLFSEPPPNPVLQGIRSLSNQINALRDEMRVRFEITNQKLDRALQGISATLVALSDLRGDVTVLRRQAGMQTESIRLLSREMRDYFEALASRDFARQEQLCLAYPYKTAMSLDVFAGCRAFFAAEATSGARDAISSGSVERGLSDDDLSEGLAGNIDQNISYIARLAYDRFGVVPSDSRSRIGPVNPTNWTIAASALGRLIAERGLSYSGDGGDLTDLRQATSEGTALLQFLRDVGGVTREQRARLFKDTLFALYKGLAVAAVAEEVAVRSAARSRAIREQLNARRDAVNFETYWAALEARGLTKVTGGERAVASTDFSGSGRTVSTCDGFPFVSSRMDGITGPWSLPLAQRWDEVVPTWVFHWARIAKLEPTLCIANATWTGPTYHMSGIESRDVVIQFRFSIGGFSTDELTVVQGALYGFMDVNVQQRWENILQGENTVKLRAEIERELAKADVFDAAVTAVADALRNDAGLRGRLLDAERDSLRDGEALDVRLRRVEGARRAIQTFLVLGSPEGLARSEELIAMMGTEPVRALPSRQLLQTVLACAVSQNRQLAGACDAPVADLAHGVVEDGFGPLIEERSRLLEAALDRFLELPWQEESHSSITTTLARLQLVERLVGRQRRAPRTTWRRVLPAVGVSAGFVKSAGLPARYAGVPPNPALAFPLGPAFAVVGTSSGPKVRGIGPVFGLGVRAGGPLVGVIGVRIAGARSPEAYLGLSVLVWRPNGER
jgi:hypothetical protein